MAPPKIAIVYYSTWGHIAKLAQAEKAGIESAGGKVDVYQIQETLSSDVLQKMHAPPQDESIPIITADILTQYDAFLFGIPTRYGNYSAQWKTFIDRLGGVWQSGGLHGKYFGVFVSTGTLGGGQEATAIQSLSSWVHQGMIFVPLGYKTAFPLLADLSEVRGGTPWGAGTFSAGDGSRQPTAKELELATLQGKDFYNTVKRVDFACLHDGIAETQVQNSASTGTDAAVAGGGGSVKAGEGNEAVAPAANTVTAGKNNEGGEQKVEDGNTGPCGLPFKCVIL